MSRRGVSREQTTRLTSQEIHHVLHIVDAAPQLTFLAEVVYTNLRATISSKGWHRKFACNAHKELSSFRYIANTGKRAAFADVAHCEIEGRIVAVG